MNSTIISTPSRNDDPLLLDRLSSARRRKLQLIIVLIVCFSLILAAIISVLAVLKHHIDSESPAKNPTLAIRSACSHSLYPDYCFRILSPLRNSSETKPTQIFTLSVRTAIDALRKLIPLPESTHPPTQSTLSSCELLFNQSLSQLGIASTTLGVDPDAAIRNLTAWLSNEGHKVLSCLNRLDWSDGTGSSSIWTAKKWKKMHESMRYASSGLVILSRANTISETFNPAIKSTLASFLGSGNRALTVCVFGLQYLYLVVLFCILLRLY